MDWPSSRAPRVFLRERRHARGGYWGTIGDREAAVAAIRLCRGGASA
ncbi:Hypothetical protein A7982_01748 [Minicystis rosea]|nr:Hypothetical protein A7982_01748 [Minicystis rosea]